jgi:hypothetical protein
MNSQPQTAVAEPRPGCAGKAGRRGQSRRANHSALSYQGKLGLNNLVHQRRKATTTTSNNYDDSAAIGRNSCDVKKAKRYDINSTANNLQATKFIFVVATQFRDQNDGFLFYLWCLVNFGRLNQGKDPL